MYVFQVFSDCAKLFQSKIARNIPSKIAAAALADGIPPETVPQIIRLTSTFNVTGLQGAIAGSRSEDVQGVIMRLFQAQKQAFGASYRFAWIMSVSASFSRKMVLTKRHRLIPFVGIAIACIFMLSDPRADMNYKIDVSTRRHYFYCCSRVLRLLPKNSNLLADRCTRYDLREIETWKNNRKHRPSSTL